MHIKNLYNITFSYIIRTEWTSLNMIIEGNDFFERFEKGFSFQDWLEKLDDVTKDKVSRYYDKIYMMVVSEFKEKLSCDYKVNILGIVDNLCGDCQFYVPVIVRLEENNPNIQVKLLLVQENSDIHQTTNGG